MSDLCSFFAQWNFRNWTGLAGTLTGAPAIIPNYPAYTASGDTSQPIYIVTGSTHHLYYRTDGTSWQLLSNGTCYDNPGAYEDSAGNLTVACQGVNQVIYYATGSVSNSAVSLGGFSSLGGSTAYGLAVTRVQGQVTFFVSGTTGTAWSRTVNSGWINTGWPCVYHPAAAAARLNGAASFACHGSNNVLSYAVNTGSGWSALASAGGSLVNGPGIAAYSSGAIVFVEGVDGEVYKTIVAATGGPQSFRRHSNGIVQFGVGASAF